MEKYKRHSIRIQGYDYSKEGMYFITICTQYRKKILCRIDEYNKNACRGRSCACPNLKKNVISNKYEEEYIENVKLYLYNFGKIVKEELERIDAIYNNVKIDKYVIMPNHIHFIIEIKRASTRLAPTINEIIRDKKSRTTLEYIRKIRKPYNKRIWQRNYYEHIIRNEDEYWKIIEYIENNPIGWKNDEYNN